MLTAKTELRNAQKVKEFITKKNLLHKDYLAVKEFGFMYFPLTKKIKIPHAEIINTTFSFPQKEKPITPEDLLKGKLTSSELALIPKTQEIIGTIMILEISEPLIPKETIIAEAYLKSNQQVKTIVKKEDIHSGKFRTRKVKILAGEKTTETIHLESGVKIKLDIEKVYFSARTGSERLRIASQVKDHENILVMFAGAAPFPLVIAKNAQPHLIYAIELNPIAHQYAMQNIELNHFEDKIHFYLADVRKQVPKLKQKFDRLIMPLPKTSEEFLPTALPAAKKGGIIHLYSFLQEFEFASHRKKIREICSKLKYKVHILRTVKCGQFAPGTFRVCFDIKVN